MPEWRLPQYLAQKRGDLPGLLAVNQRVEYLPGTTSDLVRNAGTKKLWITSSDVMVSFTARPTGTCSSLISRCPSRCSIFHIHSLATTQMGMASSGGRLSL